MLKIIHLYLCPCFVCILYLSITRIHADEPCCRSHLVELCLPNGARSSWRTGLCLDCTSPTPYCGQGRCNIFGCNCADGCRMGQCAKPCGSPCLSPIPSAPTWIPTGITIVQEGKTVDNGGHFNTPDFLILQADLDKDGMMNLTEAYEWLSRDLNIPKVKIITQLGRLDKNKDGYISAQEIHKGDRF